MRSTWRFVVGVTITCLRSWPRRRKCRVFCGSRYRRGFPGAPRQGEPELSCSARAARTGSGLRDTSWPGRRARRSSRLRLAVGLGDTRNSDRDPHLTGHKRIASLGNQTGGSLRAAQRSIILSPSSYRSHSREADSSVGDTLTWCRSPRSGSKAGRCCSSGCLGYCCMASFSLASVSVA